MIFPNVMNIAELWLLFSQYNTLLLSDPWTLSSTQIQATDAQQRPQICLVSQYSDIIVAKHVDASLTMCRCVQ